MPATKVSSHHLDPLTLHRHGEAKAFGGGLTRHEDEFSTAGRIANELDMLACPAEEPSARMISTTNGRHKAVVEPGDFLDVGAVEVVVSGTTSSDCRTAIRASSCQTRSPAWGRRKS
jgi:hypothetical protein